MTEKWDLKVVRVNFSAVRGDFENEIEDKVRPYINAIEGEIKDIIYTNPTDIGKAIIFILFKGKMNLPAEKKDSNVKNVERDGVKASIETKEE